MCVDDAEPASQRGYRTMPGDGDERGTRARFRRCRSAPQRVAGKTDAALRYACRR